MNRYPVWKYAIIVIVLLVGLIYSLPNFFGEAPAVQVSAAKSTVKVDAATQGRVEEALKTAGLTPDLLTLEGGSLRARFATPDEQLKARDVLQRTLVPDASDPPYVVALNLVSRSPAWLTSLHAFPMYLGLDLRGGVDFLLQVDMKGAIDKKAESFAGDLRTTFRDKGIRGTSVSRNGQTIEVSFRDAAALQTAKQLIQDQFPDLATTEAQDGANWRLTATIKPEAARRLQDAALKQNITTLHNRINELGVAEPVIQQQGLDRIVVQLPGVQDTAKAKDILGRTATLEMRLVDESAEGRAAELSGGPVPFGSEKFFERNGRPVIVKKQVLVTGESLTDAQPGFDQQSNQPKVDLTMDAKGGRIMRDVSRENYKKRMAMLIFEKGKGEVLTAPSINGELGNRFQISGSMTVAEAADLALLLRAGSLAAPMEIIQERTIGPTPGRRQHRKGLQERDVWLPGHHGVHVRLLRAVRPVLVDCAGRQPDAAGGHSLDAAGHAHAARHRGHGAGHRCGHRLQRADQRARARRAAQRRLGAGRHSCRLRPRLGHDSGLQRDHADRRHRVAGLRLGPCPRLRGGALHRHRHLDVLRRVLLARSRELLVRQQEKAQVGVDRHRVAAQDRRHRRG